MDILKSILPNFSQIFYITFLVIFKYYGWVFFVIGAIYGLWRMYYLEIMHQFVHNQEWMFLQIKVPRENMVSTLAVESIFAQMHSLHNGKTFGHKYVEGQIQLWYSLEIVSFGGKISFIMRIPARMKDVVESAFYSQYPQAEISEVADYMENFNYDPDIDNGYEMFGTEWKLNTDDVIPIKTYKDFEHPTAEEKIIDPLSTMFEGLAKIDPFELIAVQIIIQPLADDEWHPKGERKIKELTGEEIPHEVSFVGLLLKPFEWFAKLSYKEAILGGGHGHEEKENKPRNNWMSMTEAEKGRVSLIETKIGKPGYKTKIRMLYMAPKDKYTNNRKSLMSGLLRPLGSVMTNKLKPDVSRTWTGADYYLSETLERGYMEHKINKRKRNFIKGYKNRDIHIGLPMFVFNIEEIATIFHFPITTKTTLAPTAVEKTESKKSQAPANLPVGDIA
ncbi:MAG TPA: hypothetical protein VE973_00115 [Candidatus Limnocylindria bacterium]|nr:hypothetical protein [Candidatus Limnocylindria bacterium]